MKNPLVLLFNRPLKFGQKLVEVVLSCIFFHMVIVKHETHHSHDFVVKFVIFNVNRVNFYQEQCTVTLIQRKRRSKNRLGAETIAALLLLLRAAAPPLRAV